MTRNKSALHVKLYEVPAVGLPDRAPDPPRGNGQGHWPSGASTAILLGVASGPIGTRVELDVVRHASLPLHKPEPAPLGKQL
jgi:hypothetical protein